MKIAWSPLYAHPLPEGHRFPMEKYNLVPEQLLYEGTVTEKNFFTPSPVPEEILLLAHDRVYWEKLNSGTLTATEMRRTGFPWSPELVGRERVIMQGTLDAARFALQDGVALNVSGGTHHAYRDRGEGFCLLNDFAIASLALLHSGEVQRILICDLDVHQGNGTASILQHTGNVFTFSMHCEVNYPALKEKSTLDVSVPQGTGDRGYLELLKTHLDRVLEAAQPELICYLCGVDVLATDKLGKLKLSREGCRERDRVVMEAARQRNIPLVAAPGGGYSTHIRDIVEAHCNTFRIAAELWG